jgi:hypothetical protein
LEFDMGNRTCSVEGCESPYRCKGYCNMHYKRLRSYGSLDDPRGAAEDRFRSSGKRGVYYCPSGRWTARLQHDGKQVRLGRFDTLEEAAEAVRLKRLELYTHSDVDLLPSA